MAGIASLSPLSHAAQVAANCHWHFTGVVQAALLRSEESGNSNTVSMLAACHPLPGYALAVATHRGPMQLCRLGQVGELVVRSTTSARSASAAGGEEAATWWQTEGGAHGGHHRPGLACLLESKGHDTEVYTRTGLLAALVQAESGRQPDQRLVLLGRRSRVLRAGKAWLELDRVGATAAQACQVRGAAAQGI